MLLPTHHRKALHRFFSETDFRTRGALITDLDGTAIYEWAGRYGVPVHVEEGMRAVYEAGRPVVVNTLRFPLSVMRTFGREWYRISRAPILSVLLNGSLLGYIHEDEEGVQRYEEIAAYTLEESDITRVLEAAHAVIEARALNLLVFYYPRDWRRGEIIWMPDQAAVPAVVQKYKSADHVWSSSIARLEEALRAEELCMVHLHANMPGDERMAYQHTHRRDFFTRAGVDKLSGTRRLAEMLGFSLEDSIGAGDSGMDTFLSGVAQALHIGQPLEFESRFPPIVLAGSEEFAALLEELAAMSRSVRLLPLT